MRGIPWVLNAVYLLLVLCLAPFLLYRIVVQGKNRSGWREKLWGELPPRSTPAPTVWLHAVSVGEVLQLPQIVAALMSERPELHCVISTTTSTGLAVARDKLPEHTVCYFPLDFSWAVRRALRRVAPDLIVLVELEMWPNFIFAASRQGVPLALINGRISDRSYGGYRRIRRLMSALLSRFRVLALQNGEFANRLLALGAEPGQIHVTGSVKFDHVCSERNNPQTAALRTAFALQPDETVWVAGSTQTPEEEIVLKTYAHLLAEFPDLRLILVPRHAERFEDVAELIQRAGFSLQRRSRVGRSAAVPATVGGRSANAPATRPGPPTVILLDTLGELAACWGLADIAFVGGSLTQRGGQNMIEPAAYGAAVLLGPNTWNFRDVVELLGHGEAAVVVSDEAELLEQTQVLLRDAPRRRQLGQRAQELVLAQQGATHKTVQLLLEVLAEQTTSSRR